MGQKLTPTEWENLSAWLDGELPVTQAKQVEAKVAADPAWADALREMQAVDAALDEWGAPEPDADLAARICHAARRQRPQHRILRLAIPLSAAAAVLIAVGVALFNPAPDSVTPTQQNSTLVISDGASENIPDTFVVEGIDVFTLAPAPKNEDLQTRINRITGGSLSEAIGASQTTEQRWAALTGEQQDQARQQALAFLKLDPDEQQRLINGYADAVAADPVAQAAWLQRSRWLKVVLESFTPEQKHALRSMSPARRAETFIQRRAELQRQGKLD